ncbi:hypothetical protein ZIOFF_015933 [Zingiber officinale]|uniref:Uncharacterized protein n=1 Tax=Zingiber officinale TaxID=94328 RepID=A0A8J5LQM0_ZINOF|nr:hypothetical protein ZIOFF_015933 [Zingiber officinale]
MQQTITVDTHMSRWNRSCLIQKIGATQSRRGAKNLSLSLCLDSVVFVAGTLPTDRRISSLSDPIASTFLCSWPHICVVSWSLMLCLLLLCLRNTKLSYTRDELLVFGNLCSKLPGGFNSSVLSKLDETFIALNERQRGSGVSIFHSAKNSDYTSLPQTRPNSTVSFYWGSSGRWDARSSESNIRDGDFESNHETNIQGLHYAQHAEHDGLLATGTYQRPSGSEEPVMEKSRVANQFQLNKTPESYQPQQPYKALHFQRKDSKDLCNDETFGTNGYSNGVRTEEWRRRESFELIRKQQQKALQEKQKQIPDNHKQNLDAGIVSLLDSSADKKNIIGKADEEEVPSKSQIESSRVSTHTSLPRPLVPPGFATMPLDKILPAQSLSCALEAPITDTVSSGHLDSIHDDQEKFHSLDIIFDDSVKKIVEDFSSKTSALENVNKVQGGVMKNNVSDMEKIEFEGANSFVDNSVSILERLLGGSLHTSSSSATSAAVSIFMVLTWMKNHGRLHFLNLPSFRVGLLKVNLEKNMQKFFGLLKCYYDFVYLYTENKLSEDLSSKNLLSLITNKGKVGSSTSIVSHDKLFNHLEPDSITCNNARHKFDASPTTALMVEVAEQFHQIDKPDQNHVVLTCEELEQSILADLEGRSNLQHVVHRPGIVTDENMKHLKSDIDDEASQHLLSLLRKEAKKEKEKEMPFGTGVDVEFLDKLSLTDKSSPYLAIPDKNTTEIIFSSEKSMILEALFGANFMNELQFAQAPVSTRRAVIDDETNIDALLSSVGLPFPKSDASFCSRSGNCQLKKFVRQIDIAPLSKAGLEEKNLEFHLPDEDSLIIESDILEPVISDHLPFVETSKNKELVSKINVEHLKDKLLTGIPKGDIRISVLDATLQRPHNLDRACALKHHCQGMKASHTINYTRTLHPLLQHLTNRNQQIKHIGSQQNLNVPQNFRENVVPHNVSNHAIGPTSYDMMSQQMSIPRNFQYQLPLPGFARGIQLPCQIIFLQRYLPKTNNVDNIPLQQQQPTGSSSGIGIPGAVAGGGGNHPEAFQRHPCPAAAGHIPSVYGPEFRYR